MASNTVIRISQVAPLEQEGEMVESRSRADWSYGRWLATTLSFIAFLVFATAWLNWRLDILGLFGRNNTSVFSLDRYSLYAMSYRYIPEHFDGLLLGNSLTTNWDTSVVPGFRVFNCSMRGANFSEENLIARNVLAHGNPKMLTILLHPSFTSSHGRLTLYMTPEEYWSSFGSLQMFTIYSQAVAEKLAGPDTQRWAFQHRALPFGGQNFRIADRTGPADELAREFHRDPIAEKELRDLINTAHHRRIQLYFVIPPTYAERWQINGRQIQAYYDHVLTFLSPQDHLIDLHDGSLRDLTQDHQAFPDYTHLSLAAARKATQVMAQRIAATEVATSPSRQ